MLVRDLRAESGVAAERGDAQHLNGTLTFVDCADVAVEDCTLKCAPGAVRAATCLTASYSAVPPHPLRPGAVRVRGCRLLIGHEQIGILLRDTGRVQIADNVLQGNRAEQPNIGRLAENKRYRAALRHLLISKVPAQPTAEQRARIITVPGGDVRVQFMTAAGITAQDWQALMEPLHPEHVGNSRDLFRLLKRAANQLILGTDLRVARLRAWREQMQTANHVAARTGIVIAGEVAREVRIIHNSLRNVRRGIHVATSHADRTRRASVLAGRVTVTDNEIHLLAPLPALGPHVGIYAGNCGSLLIADNFVDARAPEVPDPTRLPLQGVRIFGFLGRVAIVRQNHLVGVPVGVFVHPLTGTRGLQNQWLVADNMAVSAQHAVVAEGPNGGLVRQDHNFS